eukprot:CAMPEP_0170603950 /NCGR_PEP_ID=MMETSP0224-20130122/19173_1 /TAXON_ID=285029 /ORGANISM="Togula jolla, Strain CCCM 725" /LENGTH=469 /DNA_ID=CAMNT_0010928841 /DNA_START=50 /DNA_END=1459 /DNA_ORIENTATION=+
MGCGTSMPQKRTQWACQYCGIAFAGFAEADWHEKNLCRRRPGGAQQPQQQPPQQQQLHIKCGGCQQVFGAPPGHAQVRCPHCNAVNVCSSMPKGKTPPQTYHQDIGQQPASNLNQGPVQPSGRKRALLVGINYFGTRAELRGCINDVRRMQQLLTNMYGFETSPDCMRVLTDEGRNPSQQPTRSNIIQALRWLVQGAQPGDVLFFHFSGHGAQQEDPSCTEEDCCDETICPVDFQSAGMIVDDEIFDIIVGPLPSGVKLTAVMDCCHSGTGLDLPFELRSGTWKEEDNPCHSAGDVLLISGCQDEQTSSDGGGYGRPQGAMTSALCSTIERNPVQNHTQLLQSLRAELRRGGFDQVPSLTASQPFDATKPFSPCDYIESNRNPTLGRLFRRRKQPKRPGLLKGGLGEMLMAGAVGFVAADMLGGAIMPGLLMGGGGYGEEMASGGGEGFGMLDGIFGGGGLDEGFGGFD